MITITINEAHAETCKTALLRYCDYLSERELEAFEADYEGASGDVRYFGMMREDAWNTYLSISNALLKEKLEG